MASLDGNPERAPRPLYERIKSHIVDRIRKGDWPVGRRIPSENQLVVELSVSRMTVNRALRELTEEGFVSRVPGVGTFVRGAPGYSSLVELRNISEEIRERGNHHRADVKVKEVVRAGDEIAHSFDAPGGTELYHVVIVHSENGLPVQLEDRYCNPATAPDFLKQDYTRVVCTDYLVSVAPVEQVEHVVRAVLPSDDQQALLRIAATEPCLALERRTWALGTVASLAILTYPGGRYMLRGRYATSPTGRIRAYGDHPHGETVS